MPLLLASSTDLAIASALRDGTLKITECEGRLGAFVSISDPFGLIEAHNTRPEAVARVEAIRSAIEPGETVEEVLDAYAELARFDSRTPTEVLDEELDRDERRASPRLRRPCRLSIRH